MDKALTESSPHTSVYAIIAAAGNSTRMGGGRSKALIELGGQTVVERSVAALARVPGIQRIVVLARAGDLEDMRRVLSKYEHVIVGEGGATRKESVSCGLDLLAREATLPDRAVVLVHDAARCLVSDALISSLIDAARAFGAAIPGLALSDTVKSVDASNFVSGTLNRNELCTVQTPQAFLAGILRKAHAQGGADATDDSMLVEPMTRVKIVPGERSNIKITTTDDVALAEWYLQRREPANG